MTACAERIPQSIAIRVAFKAFLSSDHVSPATGKTIAITISKNGAAFGNPSAGATNATAIANGWYYVDLSTTDTGTLGPLVVKGAEGTIDDVGENFRVVNNVSAGFDGAMPELAQATPPATPTRTEADMFLYMEARNKLTVTGTSKKIFNDAGTCIAKQALTNDGTTFTQDEAVSGP